MIFYKSIANAETILRFDGYEVVYDNKKRIWIFCEIITEFSECYVSYIMNFTKECHITAYHFYTHILWSLFLYDK